MTNFTNLTKAITASTFVALGVAACSGGGTDGGGSPNANAASSSGAALTLSLDSRAMQVSGTTAFLANVAGVSNSGIRIFCDTDSGLSLLEPVTGATTSPAVGTATTAASELTNSRGSISGTVGCSQIGSFTMVCGLTSGKRTSTTVSCSGPVPAGFASFAGSKGGGLGGGSSGNGNGNTEGAVRITQIDLFDTVGSSTDDDVVDISFDTDCNNDGTFDDPEPFSAITDVEFTVVNNLTTPVIFESYTYEVSGRDANGASVNLSSGGGAANVREEINFYTPVEVAQANGGSTTLRTAFLAASNGTKSFLKNGAHSGIDAGTLTVNFTLIGVTEGGDPIEVSLERTVSFAGVNRCAA